MTKRGGHRRSVLVVSLAMACAGIAPAPAQERTLTAAEITSLIVGKTIVYQSACNSRGERTSPFEIRSEFRSDGSFFSRCFLARTGQECSGPAGKSNVGVWRFDGNAICYRSVMVNPDTDICVAFVRVGTHVLSRRLTDHLCPRDLDLTIQ